MKDYFKYNWLILLVFTILTVLTFFLMHSITGFIESHNNSYKPIAEDFSTNDDEKERKDISSKRNISFLMLGMDEPSEKSEKVRTDSIIVATYNSDSNSIKMVRIPRDLYVLYDGYKGKINGIYEEKGLGELRKVIENYTGVPITNYAITDFGGLKNIVDTIDGIRIKSDITIDDSNNKEVGNVNIDKGITNMNGKEALAYSRIRYIDNDIERGKRQEQVIKAILTKITSLNQLPRVEQNVREVSKHISTDIRIRDVLSYATKIKETPSIDNISFEWNDFEHDGESYVNISEAQRETISHDLRDHLGIRHLDNLENEKLKPDKEDKTNDTSDEDEEKAHKKHNDE